MHWGWFLAGAAVALIIQNFPKLYALAKGIFTKKVA